MLQLFSEAVTVLSSLVLHQKLYFQTQKFLMCKDRIWGRDQGSKTSITWISQNVTLSNQ